MNGAAPFPAQGNGYSGVWCRGLDNAIIMNLVSGNSLSGIDVWGSGTTIAGNLIGTDASGSVAVANQQVGILIANGASDNDAEGCHYEGTTQADTSADFVLWAPFCRRVHLPLMLRAS